MAEAQLKQQIVSLQAELSNLRMQVCVGRSTDRTPTCRIE
jgi:ribosomal protein L29